MRLKSSLRTCLKSSIGGRVSQEVLRCAFSLCPLPDQHLFGSINLSFGFICPLDLRESPRSKGQINPKLRLLQLVMFTWIPVGVITYLPVELVRHFSWDLFLAPAGSTIAFVAAACWVFYAGLKRYASGHAFGMRGYSPYVLPIIIENDKLAP